MDRHRWLLCRVCREPRCFRNRNDADSVEQPKSGQLEQNFLREFKEGFQYVWASPVILSSIVAAYTFAIFIVTYQGFLPVFAKEVLEVGPEGLGIADGGAGYRRHRIPDFPGLGGRAMEPGEAFVDHDDCDADFSHPLLRVAGFLAFGCSARCSGGRTGQFPHHQPRDHSDRGAARSSRTGDERIQHGSRNALPGFHRHGRLRYDLWRLPRDRAHRGISLIVTTTLFYRLLGKKASEIGQKYFRAKHTFPAPPPPSAAEVSRRTKFPSPEIPFQPAENALYFTALLNR